MEEQNYRMKACPQEGYPSCPRSIDAEHWHREEGRKTKARPSPASTGELEVHILNRYSRKFG